MDNQIDSQRHRVHNAILAMTHLLYPVTAGILSWGLLHRYSVHGDYCALTLVMGVVVLYLQIQATQAASALALTCDILLAYLSTLIFTTVAYRLSPLHPLFDHPGPFLWRISSFPLACVSYGGHRHRVLDDLHRRYGKFVRIGPNALSINSCNASGAIYGPAYHMQKSDSYRLPGHINGVALFFQQSREDHATRKQIWSQAFTSSAIKNFMPILDQRTWQLTHCIETRAAKTGVVDMAECLCHWSYDFMGDMVFGGSNALELMDNGDPRGLIMGGKKATVILDSFGQTPWLLDILWHLPGGKSMQYLRQAAASMMRTRVNAKDVRVRDLTSYLLDGHPRTGQQISLSDLEIDAIVAIQGGSDNTGTTMAIAIYFMLLNPAVYKLLQSALDEAFPDLTSPFDKDKLASIPFLDAVLYEALRLGSPFFLPRVVPPDGAIIDDIAIPGGTIVALAAYSQQVSEENFYPKPLEFLPQRWLPGGLGPNSITNKAALFSFSSGPHVCIAKSFAMEEMRQCLSRLVTTFDMALSDQFDKRAFYENLRNMRTTLFGDRLMVKVKRRSDLAKVCL